MREKNIFIGILVIALIAIAVVGYRAYYGAGDMQRPELKQSPIQPHTERQPETPTAPPVGTASRAVVTYGANGFSPSSITVAAGETVVFMNENSVDVWPASAPHPTHTDYPEFDAKKPVTPGNSYSFTFTRVGTWKYHSHLNPTHFGSVVVTP